MFKYLFNVLFVTFPILSSNSNSFFTFSAQLVTKIIMKNKKLSCQLTETYPNIFLVCYRKIVAFPKGAGGTQKEEVKVYISATNSVITFAEQRIS